jgi:Alpha-L-fucosidase
MVQTLSTTMLFIAAILVVTQESIAEPVVKETREGGTSVIRIIATDGVEKVYRIDLSQRHTPASEQNALLKKWESYRFGAFVCYNTNQFTGSELCSTSEPKIYNPKHLDVAGWVKAFKDAGMKYAVLTTRHNSGFLLWDSATTDFDVAFSGNTTNVCREFANECRRQGLAPAFYYCLWGGKWSPNPNARATVLAQLYELATQFGEIPYFWLDMGNWAPPDLSIQEIYDALKTLQPNAVVEFNQHVQDGTKIRYFPTDVVDGELVPPPATGHSPLRTVEGKTYYLPFDYNLVSHTRPGGIKYDPLGPSCWFTYGEGKGFAPSRPFPADAVAKQIRLGWSRGGSQCTVGDGPRPHGSDAARGCGAASAAWPGAAWCGEAVVADSGRAKVTVAALSARCRCRTGSSQPRCS